MRQGPIDDVARRRSVLQIEGDDDGLGPDRAHGLRG